MAEIKAGLEQLSFSDGKYVAKKIYFKEELYHGPFIKDAPDLVILPSHGYDLKGKVNSAEVFGRTDLTGMHTQDDAFFYSNHGFGCRSIFEVKNSILDSLK